MAYKRRRDEDEDELENKDDDEDEEEDEDEDGDDDEDEDEEEEPVPARRVRKGKTVSAQAPTNTIRKSRQTRQVQAEDEEPGQLMYMDITPEDFAKEIAKAVMAQIAPDIKEIKKGLEIISDQADDVAERVTKANIRTGKLLKSLGSVTPAPEATKIEKTVTAAETPSKAEPIEAKEDDVVKKGIIKDIDDATDGKVLTPKQLVEAQTLVSKAISYHNEGKQVAGFDESVVWAAEDGTITPQALSALRKGLETVA